MNNFNNYAGNRTNLRSKPLSQIRKIRALSGSLGALGDFLVTTLANIIWGGFTLGIGGIVLFVILRNSGFPIIVKNIVPAIIFYIGVILITLNVVMTNSVQGMQSKVSVKFLINKYKKIKTGSKKAKIFKPFSFLEEDTSKIVVREGVREGAREREYFMIAYNVRGTVSPTTFDHDLEISAQADAGLLKNLERKALIVSAVSVEKTAVRKRPLPANATREMIRKRNLQYSVTKKGSNNQQLKITLVLVAPTYDLVVEKNSQLVAAFNRGLVVGYSLLSGDECKARFKSIFG